MLAYLWGDVTVNLHQGQPAQEDTMTPAVHFVGPYAGRYDLAVKLFGQPDFNHPTMDAQAKASIIEGDTVIMVGAVVEQEIAA